MIQYSYLPDSKCEIFSDDSALLPEAQVAGIVAFLSNPMLRDWRTPELSRFRPVQDILRDPNPLMPEIRYRIWERHWFTTGGRMFLAALSNDWFEILGAEVDLNNPSKIIGPRPQVQLIVGRNEIDSRA